MKKYLTVFVFLLTNVIFSQEADEVGWISKFGAAGGVNPVFIFPNIKPLNDILPVNGFEKLSEKGMFGVGGSGYVYVMFIENLRIGGIGSGASQSVKSKSGPFIYEAEYSQSFGGVTIEYTIPSIKKVALSFGGIIGAGSIEVNLYKNSSDFSWDNLFGEFKGNSLTSNIYHKLTLNYFTFSPTLNLDVPINRFIAFRGGVGYTFSFGGSWKADNDKKIIRVPNELNGNSLFFQTGIYFGFFAF